MGNIGYRRALTFVIGFVTLSALPVPEANAGMSQRYEAQCSGGISTTALSFDGSAPAGQFTGECNTTFGPGLKSGVTQNVTSAVGSCVAPDGTAGTKYELLEGFDATTFTSDRAQLFTFSNSGVECLSNTSGAFVKKQFRIITGGTGRFRNAAGSGTDVIDGNLLAQPSSPGYGSFGEEQTNFTATVSW